MPQRLALLIIVIADEQAVDAKMIDADHFRIDGKDATAMTMMIMPTCRPLEA